MLQFSLLLDAANVDDAKTLLQHAPNLEKYMRKKSLVLRTDSAFDSKKLLLC
ncbi:MAG: hypothetical protein ACXWL2_03800 [Candidatus Chromulinivorax sp.]